MNNRGKFIISLDFELFWGIRDKKTINGYRKNIRGVWNVIPKMLKLFDEYNIRSTFATVGFLFASNKSDLARHLPEKKPNYKKKHLSPYDRYLELIGETEKNDKYHYASELIKQIMRYSDHEIASHTFSHYYCLEDGQTIEDFTFDLLSAINIANEKNIELETLVFPKNYLNHEYLEICQAMGIKSYRGTVKNWLYRSVVEDDIFFITKVFRLLDAYFNMSGYNCYSIEEIAGKKPYNIPASRFLRPYSARLKHLEKLRIRRIKKSMTYAARKGLVYHLWWHPHNFGGNQRENLSVLREILSHYKLLNSMYGYESMSMRDLSNYINKYYEGTNGKKNINFQKHHKQRV